MGNHESFAAAGDDQAGNDGQGERDPDLDRGAFAQPAEHIDHPADLLDVGFHHIHANPTAGKVGHCFRGRKSWEKDKAKRLAIAQLIRLFGSQQAVLYRLPFQPRDVDPRAIIRDFNIHLAAFVIGTKG